MTVDDDGVGFDEADRPLHRNGIVIMHDRAQSLGRPDQRAPRSGGGTRVELDFPGRRHPSDSPTSAQAKRAMNAPATTSVIIIDDHPLFRKGVSQLIALSDQPISSARPAAARKADGPAPWSPT